MSSGSRNEKRKEAVCVNISNHTAHHLFNAICRSRAGQYMQWRILSNVEFRSLVPLVSILP